jgi:hypothetical protein
MRNYVVGGSMTLKKFKWVHSNSVHGKGNMCNGCWGTQYMTHLFHLEGGFIGLVLDGSLQLENALIWNVIMAC